MYRLGPRPALPCEPSTSIRAVAGECSVQGRAPLQVGRCWVWPGEGYPIEGTALTAEAVVWLRSRCEEWGAPTGGGTQQCVFKGSEAELPMLLCAAWWLACVVRGCSGCSGKDVVGGMCRERTQLASLCLVTLGFVTIESYLDRGSSGIQLLEDTRGQVE